MLVLCGFELDSNDITKVVVLCWCLVGVYWLRVGVSNIILQREWCCDSVMVARLGNQCIT